MASPLIHLELFIHHETERGLLVSSPDGGAEHVWLPKSEVEIMDQAKTYGARMAECALPRRLAEEKGLM